MAAPADIGWISAHSSITKGDFNGFLKAVDVWIERPHVVNRRLIGALIVKRTSFERLTSEDIERWLVDEGTDLKYETSGRDDVNLPVKSYFEEANELKGNDESYYSGSCEENKDTVIVRKLLPKQMDRKEAILELVVLERSKKRVYFFPLSPMALEKNGLKNYQELSNNPKSYCLLYELGQPTSRVSLQLMDCPAVTSTESRRDGVLCPTVQWLQDHLLPKLCKWAEEIKTEGKGTKGSLRLIPLDQYTQLYLRLKQDYGEPLVKMWPERTDPQKFVFEDIAIASYLLILWKEERDAKNLKQRQSFVDLGCGNGLLVYILSKEGHPGRGIDVRRRKIWDLYGGETSLQEMALDPTIPALFPDVDWLIGNHSDELTPWIPVMAARSSYRTRYFVLPCCFFDFNCKFKRKSNKVSQYRGYLDFVHEVGEMCGFQVEEDSLRIPSTKRICQIGRQRRFSEENALATETIIKEMILRRGCDIDAGNVPETLMKERDIPSNLHTPCVVIGKQSVKEGESPCGNVQQQCYVTTGNHHKDNSIGIHEEELQQHGCINTVANNLMLSEDNFNTGTMFNSSNTSPSQVSSSTFQPRPSKELMRNCTALDTSLKEFIINTVARNLLDLPLKSDKLVNTSHVDSEVDKQIAIPAMCAPKWRKGGELQLSEVAKLFDKSILLQLKNECGGLQTLLRNHYYIFKVAGGVVQLRDWTQESLGLRGKKGDTARKRRRSQALWKTSMCWFYLHHPDGCPVHTEQCPYAHAVDELRERPSIEYLNSLKKYLALILAIWFVAFIDHHC